MPQLIIFRHGPESFFAANMIGMPEGEPYEAAVLDSQGNALELLYVGAHDGVNKLLGGGFQVYAGNLADLTAPQGAALIDSNNNLQVSTGSGWREVGASSGPVNLDCGSFW